MERVCGSRNMDCKTRMKGDRSGGAEEALEGVQGVERDATTPFKDFFSVAAFPCDLALEVSCRLLDACTSHFRVINCRPMTSLRCHINMISTVRLITLDAGLMRRSRRLKSICSIKKTCTFAITCTLLVQARTIFSVFTLP